MPLRLPRQQRTGLCDVENPHTGAQTVEREAPARLDSDIRLARSQSLRARLVAYGDDSL